MDNQEKQSSLPPLLTPEEIRRQTLQPYWLDPTVEYPEPHYFFDYNGVGFSPLGGIQALSGQKKNGKTFVETQLMAAALGTGTERVSKYLPGLRTREETIMWLGHEPVVLFCDTEMEQLNTAKILRRVHWLCGWDMKERSDRFFVQWLREVEKTDIDSANHERWKLIKNAIEDVNPDIVFIDGIRDIVNDFNDNKESSSIVGEMMSIASKRNICIWNVLHMNPRPGNDDESKMRGHLGTELGNKVTDTLTSSKKKTSTGVIFNVKQSDNRNKDMDEWSFEIVDDAGFLGIPKIIGAPAAPTDATALTDPIINTLRDILPNGKSLKYGMIRDELSKRHGVTKEQMKKIIKAAVENHVLNKNTLNDHVFYSFNLTFGNDNEIPF
ncbi:MAG: AAA family ATPase [Prevotella sp.]|nr:AAA family ATPase [Prevotella sp.]